MNILSFQRPAITSVACLVALLFADSVYAAVGKKKPPPQEKREALEPSAQEMQKPWQGDLTGMLDRRVIRVLTLIARPFSLSTKVPSAEQRMTSLSSTSAALITS